MPRRAGPFLLSAIVLAAPSLFGNDDADRGLIQAARKPAASLAAMLEERFGAELAEGKAFAQYRGEFLFAVRSAAEPSVAIDDGAPVKAKPVKASDLWVHVTKLETGRSHAYEFTVAGRPIGERTDIRAYTDWHYPKEGTPEGKLSEKFVHTSKLYPGMQSEWWYYISPGLRAGEPAPLMVWQDGQGFARRGAPSRLLTVTENLVAAGKIPPMVHLMIAPGLAGERRMRSIQYDTVSDRYTRFVLEEILPELEKHQKIRTDAYARGIGGQSSGGICAFVAAWLRPDNFARVLSRIGSYTAIAWRSRDERGEDLLESGHSLPFLVRKAEKRNIRVWMEDGSMDLENSHGSWPPQNVQLANSLKMREYDFQFHFGNAQHNTAHGDSMLPESLTWLWRDYDPAKTSQEFTMDPAEEGKPYFRIERLNRHR